MLHKVGVSRLRPDQAVNGWCLSARNVKRSRDVAEEQMVNECERLAKRDCSDGDATGGVVDIGTTSRVELA